MADRSKSLVDVMKDRISRTGNKKENIFYVGKDSKVRIRFLQDMEEGFQVAFHDKWGEFNHPCLSYYGKPCPNCDNDEARTADNFAWSVWNYETKKVEVFLFKANKSSPIPALVSMFENYGTLLDRDFVIERKGASLDTAYAVVPMDKARFKGTAVAFTKKKTLAVILAAFPPPADDIDFDEEEEEQPRRKKAASKKPAAKKRPEPEDDDDDDEYDDDEEDDDTPWDEDEEDEDEDEDEEEDEEDEEDEKPAKRKSSKPVRRRSR